MMSFIQYGASGEFPDNFQRVFMKHFSENLNQVGVTLQQVFESPSTVSGITICLSLLKFVTIPFQNHLTYFF